MITSKWMSTLATSHEIVVWNDSNFNEITRPKRDHYMSLRLIKMKQITSRPSLLVGLNYNQWYALSEISKFVCSTRRYRNWLTNFLDHIGSIIPYFVSLRWPFPTTFKCHHTVTFVFLVHYCSHLSRIEFWFVADFDIITDYDLLQGTTRSKLRTCRIIVASISSGSTSFGVSEMSWSDTKSSETVNLEVFLVLFDFSVCVL